MAGTDGLAAAETIGAESDVPVVIVTRHARHGVTPSLRESPPHARESTCHAHESTFHVGEHGWYGRRSRRPARMLSIMPSGCRPRARMPEHGGAVVAGETSHLLADRHESPRCAGLRSRRATAAATVPMVSATPKDSSRLTWGCRTSSPPR